MSLDISSRRYNTRPTRRYRATVLTAVVFNSFELMMRIEIKGRDEFWRDAVIIEWNAQHPQRTLIKEADGSFLIESDWLDDLQHIAGDCFSTIVVAPMDPSRRSWFRQFIQGS